MGIDQKKSLVILQEVEEGTKAREESQG